MEEGGRRPEGAPTPEFEALKEELKRVRNSLEESEALYRVAVEGSNDGAVILREGTCLYCNHKYLEILGYSGSEEIGSTPAFHHVHPDDRKMVMDFARRRQGGEPAPSQYECRLLRLDGSMVHVTISASRIMYKGRSASLGFIRDITERKRREENLKRHQEHLEELVRERTAELEVQNQRLTDEVAERKRVEESLRISEQKYRSIFENAVEGIFRTTPAGNLISVNPAMAHMHGYKDPEEMMGLISHIGRQLYVKPEQRATYKSILAKDGVVRAFEAEFFRKDGSVIWGSLNVRAHWGATGRALYYEGTVEDITSRKRAEEELQRTVEKLRNTLAGTVRAMSLTVETRDPYTAGHQKKVANLAGLIAEEMGLSADTIDNVRMAGMIHDIGKMSVPAEILSKPRNLTEMEMGLLKTHAQSGYEILKEAELPHPIALIALQHHERLDGSGYPQGLKGPEILLEARILAVADVVEAIASDRPYRPAFGIDAALREIDKNKAVLYDIRASEACLRLFREKGFSLG